jgi:hypothetical protein
MTEEKFELIDGSFGTLIETKDLKAFKSENYNFLFIKKDGQFFRWGNGKDLELPEKADGRHFELYNIWKFLWKDKCEGFKDFVKNLETDGDLKYGLPEILDLEIAEICDGIPGIGPCKFCYKSNTGFKGENMSFEKFKEIFDKLPNTITQIAFGCGTLRKHPEMWDMFKYCRENDVVPNLTVNGDVDKEEFDKIAEYARSCAVSIYDKDISYNAIKELTDRGMTQINIHYMISEETYEKAFELMDDIKTDPRLEKLGALVLLNLKPKGRAVKNNFNKLSQEKFDKLFKYGLDNKISLGFDSCGAAKVTNFMNSNSPKYDFMKNYIEPCESGTYSTYINVKGNFFPCSFSEGEGEWKEGIDVSKVKDFIKDVWFNEKTKEFTKKVHNCRECNIGCPIFDV